MSAIWGRISLDDRIIDKDSTALMDAAMNIYKLDRVDRICTGRLYFACGHQYITREAEREVLPYYDNERDTYFTADCVLDNREELMEKLELKGDMTDGGIAYAAYLKWGERFAEHLLGVFSFAVYDNRNATFLLYTDHTGSRSVNYCIRGGQVAFSTTFEPILAAFGKGSFKLCEKWIAACEATRSPDMLVFPELTPYEGVRQLMPGHYIKVKKSSIGKTCYWNPLRTVKKIRLDSDWEYRQLFLDTFKRCVESVLRSNGSTAVTLSSGLDSSAVACTAAPILDRRGEKLYSYTSVPMKGFVSEDDGYSITDESGGPKLIAEVYPNVIPEFVSCEGKSAFGEMERFVRCLEVPGKSNANMVWIDEIYRRASENGSRIVIKGQFGNSTISYGTILSLAYQRLLKGDIAGAKRAITDFMRKRRVSKKNIIDVAWGELKEKLIPDMSVLKETCLKKELLKKHKIGRTVKRMMRHGGGSVMDSDRQHRAFVYAPLSWQTLGIYDTRLGLMHGILIRDPAKDKRIIELCLALPMECFVNNGVERRMIREYMEQIVPEAVRGDVARRGRQGADFVFRLNSTFEEYRDKVLEWLADERLLTYLDGEKVKALCDKVSGASELEDMREAQEINIIGALSVFLRQNAECCRD